MLMLSFRDDETKPWNDYYLVDTEKAAAKRGLFDYQIAHGTNNSRLVHVSNYANYDSTQRGCK